MAFMAFNYLSMFKKVDMLFFAADLSYTQCYCDLLDHCKNICSNNMIEIHVRCKCGLLSPVK